MAKPLALTSGEPAGIGPDITLKAWLRRKELKLPAFYLLGDREFLARRASSLGLKVELAEVRAEDALATFADALPVVATGHAATAQPGRPDDSSADAALASIRQAVIQRCERGSFQRKGAKPEVVASGPAPVIQATIGRIRSSPCYCHS